MFLEYIHCKIIKIDYLVTVITTNQELKKMNFHEIIKKYPISLLLA